MNKMQVNDPELEALLNLRRGIKVFQNERDATPRTLTMGDLLDFQFGDGFDKVQEVVKENQQSGELGYKIKTEIDQDDAEESEDLDEIVANVSWNLKISIENI